MSRVEYAEPYGTSRNVPPDAETPAWSRFTNSARYPLEQRIEDKKRGIGRQRYPFVTWTLTGNATACHRDTCSRISLAIMVGVFLYELGVNWKAQGTPFSFHVSHITIAVSTQF